MVKECKKCGSKNLYLEPRVKGQDIMTANIVALKCKDCGAWLKWCPKDERQFYINKNQDNKFEECWVIQRDDGMFCVNTFAWTKKICRACIFETLEDCNYAIYKMKYDCRPVKVEIRVIGE